MRRFALFTVLTALLYAPSAFATCCRDTSPYYFSAHAFAVSQTDNEIALSAGGAPFGRSTIEYKTGLGLSGALGYRLSPYLRGEIEGGFRDNELDKVDGYKIAPPGNKEYYATRMYTAFANLYLDLPTGTRWTPYAGAGAGPALLQVFDDHNDWALGYQFMGGVSYALPMEGFGSSTQLILGYRYTGTTDVSDTLSSPPLALKTEYDLATHNLEAGLRINF